MQRSIVVVCLMLLCLLPLPSWLSYGQTGAPQEWVTPQQVLVLYNASWPDEDGNGRSDSQDVAEYYAVRRGIPREHLLGLTLTRRSSKAERLTYADFFQRVLVPVRLRLTELEAAGAQIEYLVTCYGMPLMVDTKLEARTEHPIWRPSDHDAATRALTGWLVNLEENFEAGVDAATGKPGP